MLYKKVFFVNNKPAETELNYTKGIKMYWNVFTCNKY